MRRAGAASLLLLVLLMAGCALPRGAAAGPAVVAYENGLWFDGTVFEPRTMYMLRG